MCAWPCAAGARACVALEIKRHNLSHKCISGFRAVSESQLSQIDWLVHSNKFSLREISRGSRVWHRTSYGFTSDRTPLCCSVFACGWECLSARVQVGRRAAANLAAVLCPGALDSEVFEGAFISAHQTGFQNHRSQAAEDTCLYDTTAVHIYSSNVKNVPGKKKV